MDYTKQPISIEKQLDLLSSRGLEIRDRTTALKQLGEISYFRLVSYLRFFETDTISHRYEARHSFEEIIHLYQFDRELRSLVFAAIQDVEISLRTKIIQTFSMRYGAFWFTNPALFKNETIFSNCLESINKEVARSNEEFIKEYFQKYDNPPLPPVWKTLEVVSMGTLSKLFCNFSDAQVKKQLAREYGLPQYTYLESWIRCVSALRNYCAHHARIWNRRFPLKPKIPARLPNDWINDIRRPIKIYYQLCCLAYLEQTISLRVGLKSRLKELLLHYPMIETQAMGFPDNWQQEPLWK